MKQTRLWLATIAALLCSLTASAHDFEVDGIYYNITSYADLTVEVTYRGYSYGSYSNEYSGAVTIHSTVTYNSKTYRVTSIGSSAFSGCSSLTSITLPKSVTSIGSGAFNKCSSLTSITCYAQTPPSLGEDYDGYYEDLFYNVSATLHVPVESLQKYASSLWKKLSISAIGSINSLTQLNDTTLYHISTIRGSWAVEEEGTNMQSNKQLKIECNSKDSRQQFAFISFDNGETHYLYHAAEKKFVNADGVLSDNPVMPIHFIHGAYDDTFVAYFGEEFYVNINGAGQMLINSWKLFDSGNSCSIVPVGTFDPMEALSREIALLGFRKIDNGKAEVATASKNVGEIEIPTSVMVDGELCEVTSVGERAFYNCSSLTSITIPENSQLTSIGSSAFSGCSSLTSITLPENSQLTSIGESAFSGCSNLTSITIPEGVTSIGNSTFYNCSSLTSITIPENSQLTGIGSSAFSGCSSLTSITIPEGVTSIGNSAFYNCSSLRRVTLNCPNVGNHFSSLVAIEEVVFGNSVISIEDNAFSGCSGITSIVIPESVTSVGSNAFSGCSGLKSLFVGTNVDTYGENVFEGCTAVEELTVMGSVMPMVPSDKFTTIRMFSPGPLDTEEFDAKVYRTATLYVPEGSLARYQMADVWKKFWYIEEFDPNESLNVALDRTTVTMTEGDVISLLATITPQYIKDKTVTWITSDAAIATVDNGVVTAVAAGTATITAKAGDKEATCVVNVLATRYVITYLVDGEVSATDTLTCGEAITLLEPTKEGYTFSGWSYVPDMPSPVEIDIAGNADAMLYTNAPCTNTSGGDQFVGWHVLFDGDANTIFHSEYSEIESADGLDHYLRVDLGEGNELSFFSFTYTTRGNNTASTPTEIIVEGANEEDGTYTTIAVLDSLPLGCGESYFSDELGNGIAYRYIRFRVTETNYNYKVCGHPYFYFAEFGMTRYAIKVHDDVMETLVMPDRDVTFVGDFSINKYLVTFKIGDEMIAADSLEYGATIVAPEAPEKEGHTFNGWGEVAETVPAGDVTYEGTYTVNSYLLTYTVDGETVQSDSVAYGTVITLLDEPTKEGYTFSGWSEAPDTMPAEDVTISGMFTVNIYKVYYYVGEELIHTAEVPYGEAIPEYIYEPTKEDEIFEGWIGETYATMPAHDVTYVANITNDVPQLIIDNIDNSQLTIYDLMGRKVTDTENLKGGIYIVNGRKVVIGD